MNTVLAPDATSKAKVLGRLALGTVQFGMNYGIANRSGQVSAEEAKKILALASASNIKTLDTAMDYGESEARLGLCGVREFDVITKISALPEDVENVETWVRKKVEASLARLNLNSVKGLLLHRSRQLTGPLGKDLANALKNLKNAGLVEKIGVSIYAPSELADVLRVCAVDLVQAPFNLVDRRLATSGWLQKLNDAGVEVHTRSAFLQGLLLMPRAGIPTKFNRWSNVWNAWEAWLGDNQGSAVSACLAFVADFPQISKIVVGVDSVNQLQEMLVSFKAPAQAAWPNIASDDEALVNPANWNAL